MTSSCPQLSNLSMTAKALTIVAAIIIAGFAIPAQAQTYNINFPAPTTFQINACPVECNPTIAATIADMNGDGNLDVVNIDGHDDINVMLGNGNGTFQEPITLSFNDGIFGGDALAVGAFGSGKILDVAVWGSTDQGYSQVEIFLGNGTGDLTYNATYTVPNSNNFNNGPNSLVAVDVNGDGKLDLVALTPYNGVFILLGNGDGTFQAPVNYATVNPNGPNQGLAVADLNGDGHPDLAISASDGLDVLLNSGTGTFGAAAYYPGPTGFSAGGGIAIGVIRTGKKPDVVETSTFAMGFATFLNSGTGTFTAGTLTSIPSIGSINNLVLADINNDKKLDVLVPDQFGNAYTFFGKGNGTFTAAGAYSLEVYNGSSYLVGVGDFNNDGTLDLLDTAGDYTSTVSLGRGDGSFQTAQFYPFASEGQYQNIAVADFNGDGIPDVVSQATNGGLGVVLGAAHGALTTKQIVTQVCTDTFIYGIAAGDVNGDGKPDVVSVYGGGGGSCNNLVAVSLGLGTGKFKKAAFYPTGAASTAQEMQIYLADVNGDGKLDIVISNSDGSISVLLNKGKGTFGAPNVITSLVSDTEENNPLTFADFNGDGKTDIAAAANSVRTNAQAVYVLLGNGDGTFGSPISTATGYYMQGLVAGDFNGDGKQDLFAVTSNWGCVGPAGSNVPYGSGYQYLQGIGDGTFKVGPQNCVFWANPGAPVATDFNADGKLDVVVPYLRNEQFNGVAIYQGVGNGTFTANQDYYPGYSVVSLGVADFNGDGMPDVAGLSTGNGGYVSILLNATQSVSISPLNVNYGSETVGSKKSETVILTNNQGTSLTIDSITLGGTDPGDFSASSNCGSSRKAGWDCTITVTFKPTTTGARSATLNIKDAIGTQTVQLNGTGK